MTMPDFTDTKSDFQFGEALGQEPVPPMQGKPQRPGWASGLTAKKEAPKATRGRPPGKPKPTVAPSKPGEFTEEITAIYASIGVAIGFRDMVCGKAIVQQAPEIGAAWDKLAESNPAVRKALRSLTKVTAFGAVIAAHAPIMMMVAQHHGMGFGPRATEEPEESAA